MPEYIEYSNGVGYKYQGTSEELEFFKNHPEEEPYFEVMVRVYVFCMLRGKEPKDKIRSASLEDVYRHIYGTDGCRSCQEIIRQTKAVANHFAKPFRKNGRTVFLPKWKIKCDWELKYIRKHPGMGRYVSCMLEAFWKCWDLREWRRTLDDHVLRGWEKRPTIDDIHNHVFCRKGFGEYHLETRTNPRGCTCCLSTMDEMIRREYKYQPEVIKRWAEIKKRQLEKM